jgi:hypothetical protein
MANATAEIMWLQTLLKELSVPFHQLHAYGVITWVLSTCLQIQYSMVA